MKMLIMNLLQIHFQHLVNLLRNLKYINSYKYILVFIFSNLIYLQLLIIIIAKIFNNYCYYYIRRYIFNIILVII